MNRDSDRNASADMFVFTRALKATMKSGKISALNISPFKASRSFLTIPNTIALAQTFYIAIGNKN